MEKQTEQQLRKKLSEILDETGSTTFNGNVWEVVNKLVEAVREQYGDMQSY
jgi:hypothetical protein